jgi:hypothetical protein
MVVVIFGLWAWGWWPESSRAFDAVSDSEESRMKLLKCKVSELWVIVVLGLLTVAVIVTAIMIQNDAEKRERMQKLGIPHPVDATLVEASTFHMGSWLDGVDYYFRMDSRLKAQDACTQWAALFEKKGFDALGSIKKITAGDRAWLDGLSSSVKRPPGNDGWRIVVFDTGHKAFIFGWDSVDGSTMELIYISRGP